MLLRMTAWTHQTDIAVFCGWTTRQEQAIGLVPLKLRPRWRCHIHSNLLSQREATRRPQLDHYKARRFVGQKSQRVTPLSKVAVTHCSAR